MLMNRLRKPNEKGDIASEILIATIGITILAVMVMFTLKLVFIINETPRLAQSTQAVLEAHGYILDLDEVEDLIGTNLDFLTEGGQGPEATVTFENAGTEKVYLYVDIKDPTPTPVLRYAKDDSLVASPRTIPENGEETW